MSGAEGWAAAVEARRSVRSFEPRPVPRDIVGRAIELAVLSPAPHHSSPWRFVLLEEPAEKTALATAMGDAWREDLLQDRVPPEKAEGVIARSHRLLTGAPLVAVCSADVSRAHRYPDERRRLAEWTLFAHATGAALQTFMVALAAEGVSSCWLSAPVFCRETVRSHLRLPEEVEPQALVLAGYPDAAYVPRPRGQIDWERFVLSGGNPGMG